jgi:hypothetical protein
MVHDRLDMWTVHCERHKLRVDIKTCRKLFTFVNSSFYVIQPGIMNHLR